MRVLALDDDHGVSSIQRPLSFFKRREGNPEAMLKLIDDEDKTRHERRYMKQVAGGGHEASAGRPSAYTGVWLHILASTSIRCTYILLNRTVI